MMNEEEPMRLAAELAEAVERADAGRVRALLESGANPNILPGGRWTPTLCLLRSWVEDVGILRLLLAAGANPNPAEAERSPLGCCLADYEEEREPLEAATILMNAGAELNAPGGWWDECPLHTAAARGFEHVVRRLLARGANPLVEDAAHRRPVDYAREAGQEHIVHLLEHHINHEALCRAAREGDAGAVQRLLAAGVEPDGWEEDYAPVAFAASKGHAEVVRLLLEAGADANGCSYCGSAALYDAACANSLDCVRLLLEHGADRAEAYGPCWQTPIEAAAGNDNIPMVQLLLEHGADINEPDGDGDRTPLMEAADNMASADMIDFLLARGAELEAVSCCGRTALLYAVERGNWDAFDALVEAGADIHATGYRSGSAMAEAARRDDVNLARFLRSHGWCAQKEPSPCLRIATERGSSRVAALLREWGCTEEPAPREET